MGARRFTIDEPIDDGEHQLGVVVFRIHGQRLGKKTSRSLKVACAEIHHGSGHEQRRLHTAFQFLIGKALGLRPATFHGCLSYFFDRGLYREIQHTIPLDLARPYFVKKLNHFRNG